MFKRMTKIPNLKRFSTSPRNDYVQISQNATVGDVYRTMEREVEKSKPIIMKNDDIISKYQDKLELAAKSKGFKSVSEMLDAQKQQLLENEQANAKIAEEKLRAKQADKTTITVNTEQKSTYSRSLGDIFDLNKIQLEPTTRIEEIWNLYHSSRNAISASLSPQIFKTLKARSILCPQVFDC